MLWRKRVSVTVPNRHRCVTQYPSLAPASLPGLFKRGSPFCSEVINITTLGETQFYKTGPIEGRDKRLLRLSMLTAAVASPPYPPHISGGARPRCGRFGCLGRTTSEIMHVDLPT